MRIVVGTSVMFTKFKLLIIFLSCVLNIILLCDTCIYGTCLSLKRSVSSRDKLNRLTTFSLARVYILKKVIAVCLKPPAMDANLRRQQKSILLLIFSVLVLVPVKVFLVQSERNTEFEED